MNAEAITNEVMATIQPWLGVNSQPLEIRCAIGHAVGSIISGLPSSTTTEEICGALLGQYGTGWTCQLPKGHAHNHSPYSFKQIPRRNRMEWWTPSEKAIADAVPVVEAAGSDVRLTGALVFLQKARESVADYIDGHMPSEPVSDVGRNSQITDELYQALRAITDCLRVEASGTSLNNARFDGLAHRAHSALAQYECLVRS